MYEIPISRYCHPSVFQCISVFLIPVNCTKGGIEWWFIVHVAATFSLVTKCPAIKFCIRGAI